MLLAQVLGKALKAAGPGLASAARLSSRVALRTKYTDSSGYTHFRRRSGLPFPGPSSSSSSSSSSPWNKTYVYVSGLVLAGTSAFYVNNLEVVPYTRRSHFVLMSPEQERRLGSQMYRQFLEQHRSAGRLLPQNHQLARLVRKVGKKIAKETESLSAWGGQVDHMKNIKWEFNVVNSDEVNAFVLPGGKVIVYSGLFKVLKSEDELAMVLAHEIGHAVARHNAEKITQQMTITMFRSALFLALGMDIAAGPLMLGLQLPYSRTCENEADTLGLQLMAKACFDPRSGPKAMSRLSSGHASAMPEFLSTHPSSATRVAKLEKQLPEALAVYEGGCHTAGRFFSSFSQF